MVFLVGAFGMNFPIFASTMAIEFGRDADGFGLLSSILAIGSLAGALLAARRDRARMRVVDRRHAAVRRRRRVSSLMPTYWAYAATLMFTGFAVVTMLTTANGYVQTTTDPALRGRVLALYMAILMGGTPDRRARSWAGSPRSSDRAWRSWWAPPPLWSPSRSDRSGCSRRDASSRDESRRFRLTIDETLPISVVAPGPEEFWDQVASTTPIRLPQAPREPERLRRAG